MSPYHSTLSQRMHISSGNGQIAAYLNRNSLQKIVRSFLVNPVHMRAVSAHTETCPTVHIPLSTHTVFAALQLTSPFGPLHHCTFRHETFLLRTPEHRHGICEWWLLFWAVLSILQNESILFCRYDLSQHNTKASCPPCSLQYYIQPYHTCSMGTSRGLGGGVVHPCVRWDGNAGVSPGKILKKEDTYQAIWSQETGGGILRNGKLSSN